MFPVYIKIELSFLSCAGLKKIPRRNVETSEKESLLNFLVIPLLCFQMAPDDRTNGGPHSEEKLFWNLAVKRETDIPEFRDIFGIIRVKNLACQTSRKIPPLEESSRLKKHGYQGEVTRVTNCII